MTPVRTQKDSESYDILEKKLDFHLVETGINRLPNTQDRLILKLFLNTGLTPNELVDLTIEDMDFSKNLLYVKKDLTIDKQKRVVSLPLEISLELKEFTKGKKIFPFRTKQGPVTLRALHRLFSKFSRVLGVKVTSGTLRKLFITKTISERPKENIKNISGLKRFDKKEYLETKDIEKIREKIKDPRDYLLFSILSETGCKLKEILYIKVKDIDIKDHSIKFHSRSSAISKELSEKIKIYSDKIKNKDNYLLNDSDSPLSKVRAFQILSSYFISAKTIRYSYIAKSQKNNVSIKVLSENTGIKNLSKFHLYGGLVLKND